MAKPDYEMPGDANRDNTYEVTVVAADNNGNRGTKDEKVMVQNQKEDWSGRLVADSTACWSPGAGYP